MHYGAPRKTKEENVEMAAHLTWIEFFVERFKFDRLGDTDCLARYTSFFRTALLPRFKMNLSFESLKVRLELVSLGVRIGKELSRKNDQGAIFVWFDIFRGTCDLFQSEPR